MKKTSILVTLVLFLNYAINAQTIGTSVEWDNMAMEAKVSLDLASAGLKLPSGRTQAEALLEQGYQELIMQGFLELQIDSSSTIADLIERGDLSREQAQSIAVSAISVAPSFSPDMRSMTASYSIKLANISNALLNHKRPASIIRTLNPISSAQYTGIIIIALDTLPIHSMRGSALAVPCLFPKIWDSDMNLIYDRSMLDLSIAHNTTMVKYSSAENIFQNNPSGLSPELQKIAGERPLRIFARGVFGINPTDLIIDKRDALLIISSEENRRLLSQGKVVFILDESVLRSGF